MAAMTAGTLLILFLPFLLSLAGKAGTPMVLEHRHGDCRDFGAGEN